MNHHRNECVFVNCKNTKDASSDVSLYRFPKEEEKSTQWILDTGKAGLLSAPSENICAKVAYSDHFKEEDFCNPEMTTRLHKFAVPQPYKASPDCESTHVTAVTEEMFAASLPAAQQTKCWVPNCSNEQTPLGKKFIPLPRDLELQQLWLAVSGRKVGDQSDTIYFCEDHFDESDILQEKNVYYSPAIPTYKMPEVFCRTCMCVISRGGEYHVLSKDISTKIPNEVKLKLNYVVPDQPIPLHEVITFCMPELNIEMDPLQLLCDTCFQGVCLYFLFKITCIEIEKNFTNKLKRMQYRNFVVCRCCPQILGTFITLLEDSSLEKFLQSMFLEQCSEATVPSRVCISCFNVLEKLLQFRKKCFVVEEKFTAHQSPRQIQSNLDYMQSEYSTTATVNRTNISDEQLQLSKILIELMIKYGKPLINKLIIDKMKNDIWDTVYQSIMEYGIKCEKETLQLFWNTLINNYWNKFEMSGELVQLIDEYFKDEKPEIPMIENSNESKYKPTMRRKYRPSRWDDKRNLEFVQSLYSEYQIMRSSLNLTTYKHKPWYYLMKRISHKFPDYSTIYLYTKWKTMIDRRNSYRNMAKMYPLVAQEVNKLLRLVEEDEKRLLLLDGDVSIRLRSPKRDKPIDDDVEFIQEMRKLYESTTIEVKSMRTPWWTIMRCLSRKFKVWTVADMREKWNSIKLQGRETEANRGLRELLQKHQEYLKSVEIKQFGVISEWETQNMKRKEVEDLTESSRIVEHEHQETRKRKRLCNPRNPRYSFEERLGLIRRMEREYHTLSREEKCRSDVWLLLLDKLASKGFMGLHFPKLYLRWKYIKRGSQTGRCSHVINTAFRKLIEQNKSDKLAEVTKQSLPQIKIVEDDDSDVEYVGLSDLLGDKNFLPEMNYKNLEEEEIKPTSSSNEILDISSYEKDDEVKVSSSNTTVDETSSLVRLCYIWGEDDKLLFVERIREALEGLVEKSLSMKMLWRSAISKVKCTYYHCDTVAGLRNLWQEMKGAANSSKKSDTPTTVITKITELLQWVDDKLEVKNSNTKKKQRRHFKSIGQVENPIKSSSTKRKIDETRAIPSTTKKFTPNTTTSMSKVVDECEKHENNQQTPVRTEITIGEQSSPHMETIIIDAANETEEMNKSIPNTEVPWCRKQKHELISAVKIFKDKVFHSTVEMQAIAWRQIVEELANRGYSTTPEIAESRWNRLLESAKLAWADQKSPNNFDRIIIDFLTMLIKCKENRLFPRLNKGDSSNDEEEEINQTDQYVSGKSVTETKEEVTISDNELEEYVGLGDIQDKPVASLPVKSEIEIIVLDSDDD